MSNGLTIKGLGPSADPGAGFSRTPGAGLLVFGQVGFMFHCGLSASEFRERLRDALDALPVDALLAGGEGPLDRWETCATETARRGIALYLWHPLLANLPPGFERMGTIGLDGRPGGAWTGRDAKMSLRKFEFVCPNHPDTPGVVMSLLQDALRATSARGLFLDKIRYPSPAALLGASLACFCQYCQEGARASGLDLVTVRLRLEELLRSPVSDSTLPALGLDRSEKIDPVLAEWHQFRCRSVTTIIAQAITIARERGCAVGLDLFAPFLSRLVGQDYQSIVPLADWVKPMLYCRSAIPSGLPIEIDGLVRGLRLGADAAVAARLGHPIPGIATLLSEGLPLEVAASQAEESQRLTGKVPSLAGIEIADRPGICQIGPKIIGRYAQLLKQAGASGVVASPDILLASRANLDALISQVRNPHMGSHGLVPRRAEERMGRAGDCREGSAG